MFNCEICKYSTNRTVDLDRHYKSKKHIVLENNTKKVIPNVIPEILQTTPNETIFDIQKVDSMGKNTNVIPSVILDGLHGQIESEEKKPKKKQTMCKQDKNKKIDEIKKQYICECGKECSCRQNLWKHKNICKDVKYVVKITQLQDTITNLEKNTLNLTEIVKKLEKDNCELHECVEKLKTDLILKSTNVNETTMSNNNINSNNSNINNTVNNNQKIISVFNYVKSNYNDVPAIETLNKKNIKKMLVIDEDSAHSIEEHIIFKYKKFMLDEFLGEIIKNAYKKEDPKQQQIWSSNVAKLTFIVRKILNKTGIWVKDMHGVDITEKIIDPLLAEIKKMLQKYVKQVDNISKKTIEEIETHTDNGIVAVNIVVDINNKKLHKKILNYIAPQFQLQFQNNDIDE